MKNKKLLSRFLASVMVEAMIFTMPNITTKAAEIDAIQSSLIDGIEIKRV